MSGREIDVGCPSCESVVRAPFPSGPGIQDAEWGDPNQLQGTEARCANCGHELELYFY